HSGSTVREPESVRPDFKGRDGAERLSPRQQAERVLWSGETLFRNPIWRVCVQHRGSDRVHTGIARRAALDFAKTTGSAQKLILSAATCSRFAIVIPSEVEESLDINL